MQERLVLVNHLSTGSIARRLLFHMVTTKPPGVIFKNELLTNIRNWPFCEASHFVRRIPVNRKLIRSRGETQNTFQRCFMLQES